MAMTNRALKPLTRDDPLDLLLGDGSIKKFKPRKAQRKKSDLTSCDLRHLHLRGCIDCSKVRVEGASISGARIFGVLCPAELTSGEIILSAHPCTTKIARAIFLNPEVYRMR
jgi:hypothetical protein